MVGWKEPQTRKLHDWKDNSKFKKDAWLDGTTGKKAEMLDGREQIDQGSMLVVGLKEPINK